MGAYVHKNILEYNKNEENARGAKNQRTTSAKTTTHQSVWLLPTHMWIKTQIHPQGSKDMATNI